MAAKVDLQFRVGLCYTEAMTYIDPTFRFGDRATVSYGGYEVGATFIAGIGGQRYSMELDGTNEIITIPGEYITREAE